MTPRLALIALAVAIAAGTRAWAAEQPYSAHILRVRAHVELAGEIDPGRLRASYPGRLLVVDLRTADEGVADERAAAQALGIRYRNLPVDGAVIDPAALGYLEALLATRPEDEMLILHCVSGNRAAMLWAALRIDAGEGADEVLESLDSIATKAPVREAVLDYARGR